MNLPADAKERKGLPIVTGVLDYFPRAIAEVAKVSVIGNNQHNPGQPLHWDKSKSTDHADCIARHLVDRGKIDSDGARHSAKAAWRALALLETELAAEDTKAVPSKEDGWSTAHLPIDPVAAGLVGSCQLGQTKGGDWEWCYGCGSYHADNNPSCVGASQLGPIKGGDPLKYFADIRRGTVTRYYTCGCRATGDASVPYYCPDHLADSLPDATGHSVQG